ncbi:MAG: nucleoside monophosphate kinase [bacterium]
MQIFLIGPSGSGKDTQAKLISQEYNLHWMSVGDLLRHRMLVDDEHGRLIASILNAGELVDWAHLLPIIKEEITKYPKNYIWTGFPRTLEQAVDFDELVKDDENRLDLVINLSLSEEITKSRIENRKNTDQNVREDDKNDEIIQRRMNWYKDSINQIEDYYNETGRLMSVDASRDIPTVFEEIKRRVEEKF